MNRTEMMAKISPKYHRELIEIIDDIEDRVNKAKKLLDISLIDDIGDVADGFKIIEDLSDDLF